MNVRLNAQAEQDVLTMVDHTIASAQMALKCLSMCILPNATVNHLYIFIAKI